MKGLSVELCDGHMLNIVVTVSGKTYISLPEFCKVFGVNPIEVKSAVCDVEPDVYNNLKQLGIVPKTGPRVDVLRLEPAIDLVAKIAKNQDRIISLADYLNVKKREREEPKVSEFIMDIIEQKVEEYRKKLIKETIEELQSK